MGEFQEAWAAIDIDRLIALLTDDAVLTLPPIDVRIEGAVAVGAFFATEPRDGRLDRIALALTRASGQPGHACYADPGRRQRPHRLRRHGCARPTRRPITGITGLPEDPDLVVRLGNPVTIPNVSVRLTSWPTQRNWRRESGS